MSPAQGSYLVGLIGISNTVARLILGALSQKLNRLFLYNTCLVICGLTMALSNYFQPIFAALAGVDCQNETLVVVLNTTVTDGQSVANMTETLAVVLNTTVTDGESVANMTEYVYSSWVCDPYYGQMIYVLSFGVTR